MATLYYTMAQAGGRGNYGDLPVFRGKSLVSSTISTSGTSAASSAAPSRCVARITSIGSAHIVTSGSAAPTASATDGWYLADGATIELELDVGWKIAAITV